MFKFVFSAVFCAALCLPTTVFAQCGCCEPTPRPRLTIEQADVEITRLERKCVTNECGCQRMKLSTVKKTVQRPQLKLVEAPADPCGRSGLFSGLQDRMANLGGGGLLGGGGSGCGCAAPADPCGRSGLFNGLRDRMANLGGGGLLGGGGGSGCGCAAPAPAPTPCGCADAAPVFDAAPVMDAAPLLPEPVAAPAAAPCCGG